MSIERVDSIAGDIAGRAKNILEEGHSVQAILQSAMSDFKSMGGPMGILNMLNAISTGRLDGNTRMVSERIAVKLLAVLSQMYEETPQPANQVPSAAPSPAPQTQQVPQVPQVPIQ